MNISDIIARIERRSAELQISVPDALRSAGVSADAVRNWRRALAEGHSATPHGRTIDAIAKALQVSSAWLAYGVENEGFSEPSGSTQHAMARGRKISRALDADTEPRPATGSEIKMQIDGDTIQVAATVQVDGVDELIRRLRLAQDMLR